MKLAWNNSTSSVVLSPDITPTKFRVLDFSTGSRVKSYSTIGWTELRFSVTFGRYVSRYILLNYLPATVLVIVSCIALWVPKEKMTSRAVIGESILIQSESLAFENICWFTCYRKESELVFKVLSLALVKIITVISSWAITNFMRKLFAWANQCLLHKPKTKAIWVYLFPNY